MNRRVIGCGAALACAALFPVMAHAVRPAAPEALPLSGSGPAGSTPSHSPGTAVRAAAPMAPGAPSRAAEEGARVVGCGPEVSSPGGVEAQTCVQRDAEGGEVWARTYYRNATGAELRLVLTLMGPGGRTVESHCGVPAEDDPGVCETPREPRPESARRSAQGADRGVKHREYAAVAEFAGKGPSGRYEDGPLLLRSGSNSTGVRSS